MALPDSQVIVITGDDGAAATVNSRTPYEADGVVEDSERVAAR